METRKMTEIYEKIANKVDEMIPDEWEQVWLYGEVLDDSCEVFFYFLSKKHNRIIYAHDIPNEYGVSYSIYEDLLFELFHIIQELNFEFKENNENVWTNITFLLDNTGKFDIKYSYEDIMKSEFSEIERQLIWEYETLGIEPESEQDKNMINRYLESKKNI